MGELMTFVEALKNYRIHLGIVFVLLIALYYGIVPDMVMDWYKDDNYSHGFLVPAIAGYFLWQRWPDIRVEPVKPDNIGIVLLLIGCVQLTIAWLGTEYFLMRSSLIVLLAGVVLFWFGKGVLKKLALPLGYLIFMVPIPYIIYDSVAFPLKLFVSKFSVEFLQMIGVVVLREGNIIMLKTTTLEVADACSGIRSLMSLLALATAYAFFLDTTTPRRWLIIAAAVPIAIVTNVLRVVVTGILAEHWGERAAQGFFHEFAGLAVFALAMAMLVGLGALLRDRRGGK